MNRFEIGRCHCCLSSCNPPRSRNNIVSLFDGFVGWTAHQAVFSVACNSNSATLAALQTVETVLRTQRPRVDADKVPMFSVGWTWRGFFRDFEPS